MSVPEQTPYIEHTGNGVTTSFALKFQCESKDHLIVLVDGIEPPIATWSLTGGNVVFTTAPAAGKKITLQRNTPFSRTTDYQSYNNSFRPPAVNKDFDWIWWKLQELGVADWILGARIDALKNYVDRKDDELKAYLLEEIRKQGVALDQLDEYYNYLMERLAQIAVDKGWDASFVVYHSISQKKINDGLESIAELLAIQNPFDGMRVFLKSYYHGNGEGGDWFIYKSSRSTENDGVFIFNGWERFLESNIYTPYMAGCACDGVTDDTLNFDKLMYALEKNNLSCHVQINDPMFFNSQCPRVGKLIDPVLFNEKNAIRLVSNVKLEINSTLKFGSFYAGSSEQPKCNILSAMYRSDAADWYGVNRHENIEVFGTGTLDFTATESENAVQDGYRWIIKASVKGMKVHGLKFIGGDFANAVQTSLASEDVKIFDNEFINLMSDKSLLHDHSTIYCIGKDIRVYDNDFIFDNVKGRLNACAVELHGSEQWFYNNRVFGYPNLVFSAILRTDQSLAENEIVYDQKVFGNTARISRSALGYWSILNKTAKLNDLEFYDNKVRFIKAPTLAEYNAAGVRGLSYPSDLSASIFTVWPEGEAVPNITYAAEVLNHILIRDNTFKADDDLLNSQIVSVVRFVGSYVRENLKIRNNSITVNTIMNRDVAMGTPSDYFKGWDISKNDYDLSRFKNLRHGMIMFLEYMQDCVFDFDIKSKFPTLDKTYNFLNFVFNNDSLVMNNTIKINPNGQYRTFNTWLGGDFNNYANANMSEKGNYVESVALVYIQESRLSGGIISKMGVQSGSLPPSVKFGEVLNYQSVMLSSVIYPATYSIDFSGVNKLVAAGISETAFVTTETSDRLAYMKFIC